VTGRLFQKNYFSDVFTELYLVLRVVPMPLTTARITMLMPVAIRQYSIAVAPDWSLKNLQNNDRIQKLLPTLHFRRNLG
jgi:hypothetical protein